MIDFHTHILPAVDDGSQSTEESLKMVTSLKSQGVNTAVATPHFYADEDNPRRFGKRRTEAIGKLTDTLKSNSVDFEIVPGAEVAYFEGISDCEEILDMKIGDTPVMLIEMPFSTWSQRMLNELDGIYYKNGTIPLLAHLDRYIRMFNQKKLADKLSGLPVLVQVNTSFFLDKKYSKLAFSMLTKGQIHVVGSDCHNMESRKPNMDEAMQVIEKSLGHNYVRNLEHNERVIFSGERERIERLFI